MSSENPQQPQAGITNAAVPAVVDRATFQAELDALRVREKAHTRAGDAIAASRRRLPMVEVDSTIELIGPHGPVTLLDVFEGRRQLIAYYFMWDAGRPAAEQCEGCTFYTTQVSELSYLESRDVTYANWTNGRGVEAMDTSYSLMDLTVYGRQEKWEDSAAGWPQRWEVNRETWRTNGRPTAQWSRIRAGRSDDLGSSVG
jgi:predicted dithiol-disulfide oxidoreductase (DUF899 family)